MSDDKEMNIRLTVEAGRVVMSINHPEDTLRIPMSPEEANELGYGLVEYAQEASEMDTNET